MIVRNVLETMIDENAVLKIETDHKKDNDTNHQIDGSHDNIK